MRSLTRLISLAIVLVVVAAIADTAVRFVVQNRLASQLQASQNLSSTPSVSIGGFPFLTQAVAGRYDSVTVTTGEIPAVGGVSVASVDARLTGVDLPLREALSGSVSVIPVSRVQADAVVSFDSLETAVGNQLKDYISDLSLSRASDSTVTVKGTVSFAGFSVPLTAPVRVTVSGNRVTLAAAASGLTGIPQEARQTVANALSFAVQLPALPYGLKITGVGVTADGITARATATNVRLPAA